MKHYTVNFKVTNTNKIFSLSLWAINEEVTLTKLSTIIEVPISEITITNIKEIL